MNRQEYTSAGGDQEGFLTTHWTAIEQVHAGNPDRAKILVGELLRTYWKPVYCYLRHRGFQNEEAKDLTQDFFYEVVLGRDLVQLADRAKGRFRTLLLRALDRYLISVHRKQTARKRIPPERLISLEDERLAELAAQTESLDSEGAFNCAWISELLDRMLADVKAQCLQDGMAVPWNLFWERVLRPIIEDRTPPSLAQLCAAYGIDEPAKASNMIFAVKRRLQSALRKHLRQSVACDADVGAEIHELAHFLARVCQDRK
jgi:DNA-directed RNA polymerase specialized sigma24 family protein